MRVYLDNCCYNRPYDDLSQLVVSLEAQAKIHIQNQIRNGSYELVTSEMLTFEIDESPFAYRRKGIMNFIKENSTIHVGPANNLRIDEKAKEIMESGVKYKDACHVASALLADCDYLITTDKRLLKYQNPDIKLVDPIQFLHETEDENA